MKKDLEVKALKKRNDRLKEMPDFITNFVLLKSETYSIGTQEKYLSDFGIYFDFLLTLPRFERYSSYLDFKVKDMDLDENIIRLFLEYLTEYKKEFTTKGGNITTQVFRNSKKGKSRKISSLHSLYEYLARKHDITNPTKYVSVNVDKKRKIRDRLSDEEIEEFIMVIRENKGLLNKREEILHKKNKERDLCIIFLLSFTGIRISELIQLDIQDINLTYKAMVVTRKGGDEDKLYLPEAIIQVLSEYIKKRKSILDLTIEDENALFLSGQNKRINPRTVRNMIEKYAQKANISFKVTPHTFRRTFATKLLEIYSNIELVAEQLGHDSIETTRKFYADISDENRKKSMEKFDYEK